MRRMQKNSAGELGKQREEEENKRKAQEIRDRQQRLEREANLAEQIRQEKLRSEEEIRQLKFLKMKVIILFEKKKGALAPLYYTPFLSITRDTRGGETRPIKTYHSHSSREGGGGEREGGGARVRVRGRGGWEGGV